MQDYKAATTMYEQLVKVCPSVEEYKVRNVTLQGKLLEIRWMIGNWHVM